MALCSSMSRGMSPSLGCREGPRPRGIGEQWCYSWKLVVRDSKAREPSVFQQWQGGEPVSYGREASRSLVTEELRRVCVKGFVLPPGVMESYTPILRGFAFLKLCLAGG